MAYRDSDYTVLIAHAATQPHNFGAETHHGVRDTSAFVMPSVAIARSLSSKFVASTVLRRPHKDSDHTAVITVAYMPKLTVLAKL